VLFNSLEYFLFFTLVLGASWALIRRPKLRIWLLLLASYYFYVSNNRWLILLILASTQIDYWVALRIEDSDDTVRRKNLLLVSLIGNLGILGFFKYFNFFAGTFADAGQLLGLPVTWKAWNILLPVGISFYTFQSMSYTLDVYQGRLKAERSWTRFAFYVAYFPQLVAGPIMRASEFMPQIPRPTLDAESFDTAVVLIARGLVKKIVFADFLASYADPAFDRPETVSQLHAWLGIYAFTFQIYFDFSGYTDIAIGCSRLMGYQLPDNFNLPYMAVSFSDFWRRWHISLSTWLRDYLYISLGGNRVSSQAKVYRNLMITMFLGGLWHGAAWHFVLWGVIHGLYLVIERRFGLNLTTQQAAGRPAWRMLLRRLLVFHGVVFTWLAFRCQDLPRFFELLRALVGSEVPPVITRAFLVAVGICVFGWLTQWIGLRRDLSADFQRLPAPAKAVAYLAVVVAVSVFNSEGAQAFIYFQF